MGVWGFLTVGPRGPLSGGPAGFLGKVKLPSVLGVAPKFSSVSRVTHLLGSLNRKWWEVVGSELLARRKI